MAFENKMEEQCRLYSLGEKDPTRTSEAFKDGITSDVAKEYWRQGMYSEKEVKELLLKSSEIYYDPLTIIPITNWFEQNKKK